VLRGVDFDVARGSIFALLGSNGAGKTTVVRILSTLLKPDAGTAIVDSFAVATQPANVRESISLTGQFAAVDEILTGRENLVLVARLRHLKGAGRIADDLLARFQLTDAAGRRVSTYSGGMRRRLDIAMSLIGNPPVIFLDEPTTGLDIQSRDDLWNTVDRLRENGSTIVLTTHYLEEAQQRADRIGLMHQGRLQREGTVSELTRTLPAVVRFSLPPATPAPPLRVSRDGDGRFLIETFDLPKDLYLLLGWAHDNAVELRDLEAGPTRLDDVFRSLGS
jgi:ABC-2 type transport system ATP-binding protein